MKKQVFFILLTFLFFGFTQKENQVSNKSTTLNHAKVRTNATVSLSSNTWGGSYTQVIFEQAGSTPVTWYPTKDIYGYYYTFIIPTGTYNHIYFQTVPGEAGPYYMALLDNGTSYPCVQVTGEWVDVSNVTINNSWVTFSIGDYCQSY